MTLRILHWFQILTPLGRYYCRILLYMCALIKRAHWLALDYSFRMLKSTPWFIKYRLYSLLEHHLEFNSSIWISKNTFDFDASCDSRDGLKSHGLSGSSREEVVNEKIRKLLSRLLVDTLCILIRTIVISLIIVTKWTSVLPKWTSAVKIRRPPIITMILGTINDASGMRIGELI